MKRISILLMMQVAVGVALLATVSCKSDVRRKGGQGSSKNSDERKVDVVEYGNKGDAETPVGDQDPNHAEFWTNKYDRSPEDYHASLSELPSSQHRAAALVASSQLFSRDPSYFLEEIWNLDSSSSRDNLSGRFSWELFKQLGGTKALQVIIENVGVGIDRRHMINRLYSRWLPQDPIEAIASYRDLPFPEDQAGFISALDEDGKWLNQEVYERAVEINADPEILSEMLRIISQNPEHKAND